MRASKIRYAGLLLGAGLGAFFEGILLHPVAGLFYMVAWLAVLAGVIVLWSGVRGPGPLPPGLSFVGYFLGAWGVFNLVEGVVRHDIFAEWPFLAAGVGLIVLGTFLVAARREPLAERRSGSDRRSGSMMVR